MSIPISKWNESAWTLALWIDLAAQRLGDAGVLTPRYDAERLAAHVLGTTWSDLRARLDTRLDGDLRRRLESAVARRAAGEPLAYIEGSRGFYGLELECGPGALVPRPETEILVDVALELIADRPSPVIVDIGTGTGAIAIAIAKQRPDAEVVASDISDDALAYAKRNARAADADIWFERGDLFDAVPEMFRGRLDLVVSNPPYVPDDAELPPDVLAEPSVALFAGPDGTEVLRRIVEGSSEWLAAEGAIALEIGSETQVDVLPGAECRRDLNGRPRVLWRRS